MAAFTSKAAGNWSASGQTTWNEAGVPGNGDTVTYSHAITVDVDTTVGTSPSDATTYVLTRSAGGSLSMAAGVTFTVRGNWNNGAGAVNLAAGAVIEFDNSQAETKTISYYFLSTNAGKITCSGTSWSAGSFCTIRSNASGGYAHLGVYGVSGSQFDCAYTKFQRLGDTTTQGIITLNNAASSYARFTYCQFDTIVGSTTVAKAAIAVTYAALSSTVLFDHCTWVNTSATYALAFVSSTDGTLTGTRSILDSVLDKLPYSVSTNLTADRNLFLGGCNGIGNAASFQDNLVYAASGNMDLAVSGTGYKNNYLLCEKTTGNPHFAAGQAAGTHTIDGFIFHFNANWATDTGDCVSLGNPASAAHYAIKNCLVLPGPDGRTAGTLVSALGADDIDFSAEHNTYHSTQEGGANCGVSMGETYAGYAGICTSFKSNIAWRASAGTGGFKLMRASGTVQELVAQANCDYNWGWNLAAGNETNGYNHNGATALWSSGDGSDCDTNSPSPGSGDPQFVDSTRNILTWDASLGGAGTSANALAELGKISNIDGDYDSAYNVADLITWVNDGFKVQNAALENAGHDSVTIGACEYQAAAGGVAMAILLASQRRWRL